MRSTILIIGLIAAAITFIQSTIGLWAGSLLEDQLIMQGSTAARFFAVVVFIASLLVLYRLLLSGIVFLIAGIGAMGVGVYAEYYEVFFWGVVAAGLGVICYLLYKDPEKYNHISLDD